MYGTPSDDKSQTPANTPIASEENKDTSTYETGIDPVSTPETKPVDYEKRYNDLRADYTRKTQELSKVKGKVEVLTNLVIPDVTSTLSEAEKQDLEFLKDTDPDAWRVKLNTLEQQAKQKLEETLNQASKASSEKDELSRRNIVFEEFVARPNTKLSLDTLDDIPNRILKKLENGEVTFEDFLTEAEAFLQANKVVYQEKAPTEPNFHKAGGSGNPVQDNGESASKQYKTAVF